jgi:hypothetical protein
MVINEGVMGEEGTLVYFTDRAPDAYTTLFLFLIHYFKELCFSFTLHSDNPQNHNLKVTNKEARDSIITHDYPNTNIQL